MLCTYPRIDVILISAFESQSIEFASHFEPFSFFSQRGKELVLDLIAEKEMEVITGSVEFSATGYFVSVRDCLPIVHRLK